MLNKNSKTGIFSTNELKIKRTLKSQYFTIYKIKQKEGYELRHIISIKVAKNKKEMELIDNINNIIYIN